MTDKKRSWNSWPDWIGVALVLIVAYAGTYYFAVQQTAISWHRFGMGDRIYPYYFENGNLNPTLRLFFAPVHWADQRIRPRMWRAP